MDQHIQELLNGAASLSGAVCVQAATIRDLPDDWYETAFLAFVDDLSVNDADTALQTESLCRYHSDYQLKLAASDAHLDLLKDGCAVYTLSGSEYVDNDRRLQYEADRMLVRGINRFILPADFKKTQKELVEYLLHMTYLFDGGKTVPMVALLHCEEALQGGYAAAPQITSRQLTESQQDYDIVSSDLFAEHRVDMIYNRLIINGNRYQALVVPDSARITAPMLGFILAAEETEFPVIFTERRPSGILGMDVSDAALMLLADTGILVPASGLAEELISRGIQDVRLTPTCSDIVCCHYRRENHLYLFLNESPDQVYEGQIYMPGYQEASIYDAGTNTVLPLAYERTDKGILANVRILPEHMLCVAFG